MDVTAGPGADIPTLGTKADTLDAGAGNDNTLQQLVQCY